jgi:outer membrane protein assembly factor BamD (BamD/ComL family)
MKKLTVILGGLALVVGLSATAQAQRGSVAKGPDPAVVSNLEEEKNSRHNLEVARHYFKQKKAYLASYDRSEEIIAGHPEFTRLDEVLYIAGMSGIYLAEGKGKQKAPTSPPERAAEYTPDALRRNAKAYLTRLVVEYPDSDFRKQAEQALATLGAAAGNSAQPPTSQD